MTHNKIIVQYGELIHDALVNFAKKSGKPDWIYENTEGGCAIGSFSLMEKIKTLGIESMFQTGWGHCWIESDGYIYDVSATQFDSPNSLSPILYPKVNVKALSDVPVMINFDSKTIPDHHDLATKKYAFRNSWHTTSDGNIEHINRSWEQGTRIRGYKMLWENDIPHLIWKGAKGLIINPKKQDVTPTSIT